jgi:5-deoxy-glucuronate isomerase
MQPASEWLFRAGDLSRDGWETVVDTTIPGWRHTGLRVGGLAGGEQFILDAGEVERILIPLSGSFRLELSDNADRARTVDLAGRRSVFDGPTDVLYLGVGCSASVTGAGRVAVAEAPTTIRKPNRYVSRAEVPVELRGAGRSSRQVHNFGTPQTLDAAKLIVCEVITPAENWSSYPPHKHDENIPGRESRLEEIYYFESAVARGVDAPSAAHPFGLFSTHSSPAGEIEITACVRTGDVALVPYGYHGPAVAAPGYDLYYLNVMAGPDDERAWNITDDPAQGWVRTTWDGQEIDPRLPFTSVSEREQR